MASYASRIVNHSKKLKDVSTLLRREHASTVRYFSNTNRAPLNREDTVNALLGYSPLERISKCSSSTVAPKTLIVIHRLLREGDPTFREALLNFSQRGRIWQLSNFKDDSSPIAWDCSAWVRTYALFLEERLECFRVLKYDTEAERLPKSTPGQDKGYSRTRDLDGEELLEQLPALQQLLYRLIGCRPEGAANHNHVIQYALALVLKESFKVYCATNDVIINLIDKFFEMPKHEANNSLDIYKRAGQQARSLSDFYEACNGLELARNFQFPVLREPPQSLLTTMEEYIKEAPRVVDVPAEPLLLTYRPDDGLTAEDTEPSHEEREMLPLDDVVVVSEETEPSPPPPPSASTQNFIDTDDLLGLNSAAPDASVIEDRNALALAIISTDANPSTPRFGQAIDYDPTGWEFALVTAPSSDISAATERKLLKDVSTLLRREHASTVRYFSNTNRAPLNREDTVNALLGYSPLERISKCSTSTVLVSSFSTATTYLSSAMGRPMFGKDFSCSMQSARGFSSGSDLPPHQEIGMPSLSPTMTEGNIARWLKKEGDKVAPGEVLCEVETDKATVEMECMEEGYLAKIVKEEGSKEIQVGEVIAITVEDEEDIGKFKDYTPSSTADAAPTKAEPTPTPPKEEKVEQPSTPPEPKASKPSAPPTGDRVFASPLARKLAEDNNVPLSNIKGTGPEGRIVKADIDEYLASGGKGATAKPSKSTDSKAPALDYVDIPHSQIRKVTASRLAFSKQTIPHYYLTVDTCVDKLMCLRRKLNSFQEASGGKQISVNDLVVKAAALALRKVPQCNSSWTDDYIRQFKNVNINVAVQT
ncbi:PREDICTED: uncharacterized protein LOC104732699 isoform X2 [Camelina sativa]|uniref:Dihydrolipoamide acetyltransferase component of pyruvate dehydrogenase complex n=1 Tax=Camelina sativa TaxID=90675 RepID=A0ABM1QSP3_CAMSA|nr:PREDICTED: uncharacterized protein LOC104732699 isoform X2 [Camelina sativa]